MSESDATDTTDRDEQIREAFDEIDESTADGDEKPPDPSQLEPLTKEEAEYARNPDGSLKTNEHPVQYQGEWRSVTVRPLLPADQVDLERQFKGRDDIEFDELHGVMQRHITDPADVDWEYAKPDVYMPCVMALMQEFMGGADSEFYDEVEDELAERAAEGEGNG